MDREGEEGKECGQGLLKVETVHREGEEGKECGQGMLTLTLVTRCLAHRGSRARIQLHPGLSAVGVSKSRPVYTVIYGP